MTKHAIQNLETGMMTLLETYSQWELNSKKLMIQIIIGAQKIVPLLNLMKPYQQVKSFSFIINLITFIKTIEDMLNQDQTLNLMEEMVNL